MNRVLGGGVVLLLLGIGGYVLGTLAPYPGQAFSITGVMAGVTLTVIGLWGRPEESG